LTRIVKVGGIQCSYPGTIEGMVKKHEKLLDEAGDKGVQIIGLQELFNGPYFCAEQEQKWYDLAEPVPGPTTDNIAEIGKQHDMVTVIPVYEEAMEGVYYNTTAVYDADGTYLGKFRKIHIPHTKPGFWEKFYFKPGNLGYPVFQTKYGRVGIYTCYDRHFPESARLLGLAGAEITYNPSATVAGKSQYLWELEQRAHCVANQFFTIAINRVGIEKPWKFGRFFGSSYVCDPRGQLLSQGSEDKDEVVIADIDIDMIRDVRNDWQFFRDRRPETYTDMCKLLP